MLIVPGKPFRIAGVLALSGIIAGVMSVPRAPAPARAAPPVVTKAVFAERFDVPNDWPLLKKQDRLPLPPEIKDPEPVPVPVPTKAVAMMQPDDEPVAVKPVARKKTVAREHDVCTRHGLHKIWIRHGKSWRCRR